MGRAAGRLAEADDSRALGRDGHNFDSADCNGPLTLTTPSPGQWKGDTVGLCLQNPGDDEGYLLEALLDASQGSTGGGAIFAWCNEPGVKALLEDETFTRFLRRSSFELIVGVDSITDRAALEAIANVSLRRPNLAARAFVHDQDALFHPKLAWFESKSSLTLIIGSGNLTIGGLRGNWEAYATCRLRGRSADATKNRILGWINSRRASLLNLDDPRVIERTKQNVGNERDLKRLQKSPAPKAIRKAESPVLIAEIPRAGQRWGQANFDVEHYEGFFGAKVGTQRRIVLYHVADDGNLGPLESRPSVEVDSRNYRFELAAARGHRYPSRDRPIGVFLRLATGEFLYRLLFPADPQYRTVNQILAAHWSGPPGRMRRITLSWADLHRDWPNSPLNKAQLPAL